jgi:hypothetical protein
MLKCMGMEAYTSYENNLVLFESGFDSEDKASYSSESTLVSLQNLDHRGLSGFRIHRR